MISTNTAHKNTFNQNVWKKYIADTFLKNLKRAIQTWILLFIRKLGQAAWLKGLKQFLQHMDAHLATSNSLYEAIFLSNKSTNTGNHRQQIQWQ